VTWRVRRQRQNGPRSGQKNHTTKPITSTAINKDKAGSGISTPKNLRDYKNHYSPM
jgi:hypothetical protein